MSDLLGPPTKPAAIQVQTECLKRKARVLVNESRDKHSIIVEPARDYFGQDLDGPLLIALNDIPGIYLANVYMVAGQVYAQFLQEAPCRTK